MLTTNDAGLAEKLRYYRVHGAKSKYFHDVVGINSRLDSLQAAILRVKLNYLDGWAQARRENAARYRELFWEAGIVGNGVVRLPEDAAGGHHVYNQFVIRAHDRDRLKSYLGEHGVRTDIYYPLPLHLQNCFGDLGHHDGDFPEAEKAAKEVLALPIYPELGVAAQKYIVSLITKFYL